MNTTMNAFAKKEMLLTLVVPGEMHPVLFPDNGEVQEFDAAKYVAYQIISKVTIEHPFGAPIEQTYFGDNANIPNGVKKIIFDGENVRLE